MLKFNGTALFVHNKVYHETELDDKAWVITWGGRVCVSKLPTKYTNTVHHEMLNIMVAIKTWDTIWSGKSVLIHCDHESAVNVLNTGNSKNVTMAVIARNI